MRRNLPYNFQRELEMVLIENMLLAAGCILWLYWFCQSERSLEFTSPPTQQHRGVVCGACAGRLDSWSSQDS